MPNVRPIRKTKTLPIADADSTLGKVRRQGVAGAAPIDGEAAEYETGAGRTDPSRGVALLCGRL
jgi:hypothetical protein